MLLQEGHNRRCGRDGAALAVLRAAEPETVARLALVEEGLLADRDRTGLKVYVIPREAEHLALTHTGEKRDRQQRFKAAALDGLQKCRNLCVVQRRKLLALHARQLAGIGGIEAQIADLYGLPQRLVEHTVNVLDGLGRKARLARPARLAEGVIELLYLVRIKRFRPHSAERGLDVQPDIIGVDRARARLDAAEVGLFPYIEPLPERLLARLDIGAAVNGSGGSLELLHDLFLRLAGDRAPPLLAGAEVYAVRIAGLPVFVFLPADHASNLSHRAGAVCTLRHEKTSFLFWPRVL